MNVIFLDFNGVLDTYYQMNEINQDNLNRLKRIVEETNAKIVISSSLKNTYYYCGRFSQHFQEILNRLTSEGLEIVGITPLAEEREQEIMMYLDAHPEIENFCIIDDDYDMELLKEHLVKLPCQSEERQMGLDDFHMHMAIDILKKKKEKSNKKLQLTKKTSI